MIKFFRNQPRRLAGIRQRLVTENKPALPAGRFQKYVIYALGEIILVVIGILIALSINNWNEKQKDLAQEQSILKQLKGEYQNNLEQLDQKILMSDNSIYTPALRCYYE